MELIRLASASDSIRFSTLGRGVCYDRHGKLKWERSGKNTIVNQGKNSLLDVYFDFATGPTNWYAGLIDTALGGSFGVATTSAEIENAAHIPEYTDYDEATRQEIVFGDPASQVITNASAAVYTISTGVSADVIPGFFVVSVNTKSATTGVLWCAVNFDGADATVDAGDTVNVTYEITFS